jgi:hypothetical protein
MKHSFDNKYSNSKEQMEMQNDTNDEFLCNEINHIYPIKSRFSDYKQRKDGENSYKRSS